MDPKSIDDPRRDFTSSSATLLILLYGICILVIKVAYVITTPIRILSVYVDRLRWLDLPVMVVLILAMFFLMLTGVGWLIFHFLHKLIVSF